jgi:hypothetical protein
MSDNKHPFNPDITSQPIGLDLNNFLPNQNQKPQPISEKNDLPIITEIQQNNNNFKLILENRIKNLKTVQISWNNGKSKNEGFSTAESLKDLGVQNDLFNYALIKTDINNLDINSNDVISFFPMILNMVSSHYDIYFKNGILTAWKVLKLYYDVIINTKQSQMLNPKNIDLNREDKIKKYDIIINYFEKLRRIPNVSEHLNPKKEIVDLDLKKFIGELDYFLKKCSSY